MAEVLQRRLLHVQSGHDRANLAAGGPGKTRQDGRRVGDGGFEEEKGNTGLVRDRRESGHAAPVGLQRRGRTGLRRFFRTSVGEVFEGDWEKTSLFVRFIVIFELNKFIF